MAHREALRELQSRLASRLQTARTEGVQASWLAVEAGGRNFLFPLAQSGEIFPLASAMPVPYTRPWFMGVANLRGGLFGVIDLAGYVDDAAPRPRSEAARADCRLIALNTALELNCALLVDRLAGLRNAAAFASSSPADEGAPPFFGTRFTDAAGRHWQEINLQALAQQPRFLSISD
ncbi:MULTISPECIES: chemotaxis protein CheW [Ramlibacter]|uniref:Chemotaxis protein CheW n=1 Tax=Ramlibacter aquaticus TaxID=2780094 RepID=A0ABR9SHA7_9BURK|nr:MULTISPECIES: chemotaxis protein CheW [Ramlibacter]MBE7941564.1 chemotaxis protein CheW [Ramlibacter aquaticus]